MSVKCELCQQIKNNLTEVCNYHIKFLAHTILKLKGFQNSLDTDVPMPICESCEEGLRSLAKFWETIPEAKTENQRNSWVLKESQKRSHNVMCKTVEDKDDGTNIDRIVLRIKLPRKLKRTNKGACAATTRVIHEKRIRRLPKRYEDFSLDIPNETAAGNESTLTDSTLLTEPFFEIAIVRLSDGQYIGRLVLVKDGNSSKMRILCQICSQIFRVEKLFQTHLRTHNIQYGEGENLMNNYSFCCKLCDKSFHKHAAVKRHFKSAHSEERPLKCEYCEASFKHQFNLYYHMARHVPIKRFECAFCNKKFLMRYELKNHLRTHTKEKPYKCEYCSLAFSHPTNLKTHQKVQHFKKTTEDPTLTDSTDIEKNAMREKKLKVFNFTPPKILMESETDAAQSVLSDRNVDKCETVTTTNNIAINENKIEIYSSEQESFLENISETESQLLSINDYKNLKLLETKESYKSSVKVQPKLGTIQLDSSILKVLPSVTLLGLKKWQKTSQNIDKSNTFKNVEDSKNEYKNLTSSIKENVAEFQLSDNSKSIIKYKPLSTNNNVNSIQLSNNYSLNNISKFLQTDEITNHSTENSKTNNLQVLREVIPKGNKFIHISEQSATALKQCENTFEPLNGVLNPASSCDVVKANSILPSKVQAAKQLEFKNIFQTNAYVDTAASSENMCEKSTAKNEILNEFLIFPQQTTSSRSAPITKYNRNTNQSLLKPILQSQQITTLSTKQPQIILPDKPLITKMEILPPLTPITITQMTDFKNTAANLIKPPTDYKYQCTYCCKYFKQKSTLVRHHRTHTGEKPYKCNLCPKSYADSSNYKKHKILHKNAAASLNISPRTTVTHVTQNSPAYSTVSDPDPDGVEVMETIKKFDCSSTEDDDDINYNDKISFSSSTVESNMWQNVLENALMNEDIRENIKRNLQLPAPIKDLNHSFCTKDSD